MTFCPVPVSLIPASWFWSLSSSLGGPLHLPMATFCHSIPEASLKGFRSTPQAASPKPQRSQDAVSTVWGGVGWGDSTSPTKCQSVTLACWPGVSIMMVMNVRFREESAAPSSCSNKAMMGERNVGNEPQGEWGGRRGGRQA